MNITTHLFNNSSERLLDAIPRISKAMSATPGARIYLTARGLIVTAATAKRGWYELKMATDMSAAA